ncbi:hypothetical protein TNCV_5029291 [Trichonephila clavipes]|nr:hypothetical protein TNCV_5029291 [Trichonephila clavipes]
MYVWPRVHGHELIVSVVELWVRVLMSQKTHRVERLMHTPFMEVQNPHIGTVWKLEEKVPAQASSSSLDHKSQLRGSVPKAPVLP